MLLIINVEGNHAPVVTATARFWGLFLLPGKEERSQEETAPGSHLCCGPAHKEREKPLRWRELDTTFVGWGDRALASRLW